MIILLVGHHVGTNGYLIYLRLDTIRRTIKITKTSGYQSAVHKEDMKMKEKTYSEVIANAIKSYLKEDDWHFSFDEESGLFEYGLSLRSKIKKISYIVDVKESDYIVYAIAPIGADEEDKKMIANMAEFELDMIDGEIRFKCFVDCDGITPTEDMVRHSIHCPAAMFNRYGAGIVDIIYGNATAKEAVEKCEKATEDEMRSLLSELMEGEGGSEFSEMLTKLAERLGVPEEDNDESSDTDCVPAMIKTDLFGTEGDDD